MKCWLVKNDEMPAYGLLSVHLDQRDNNILKDIQQVIDPDN